MYQYECFINIFSADLLAYRGTKTVIVVDVASEYDNVITNYGDSISGWKILLNKYNPFVENIKVGRLSSFEAIFTWSSLN